MTILTSGNHITVESIPLEIRLPQASRPAGDRILQALDQTDWNVSSAARVLGIERANLHKHIRALGLARQK